MHLVSNPFLIHRTYRKGFTLGIQVSQDILFNKKYFQMIYKRFFPLMSVWMGECGPVSGWNYDPSNF